MAKCVKIKHRDVYAKSHVRDVFPPMYGTYKGICLSEKDILSCLNSGAIVYEILNDGTRVQLSKDNYNKNLQKIHDEDKELEDMISRENETTLKEENTDNGTISLDSQFIGDEDETYDESCDED